MAQQLVTEAWPSALLTLGDWEALPGDEQHRFECVEGILTVAPRPLPQHQRLIKKLIAELDGQLPPSLEALAEVEVLLFEVPLTVRVPDVLVTTEATVRANPPRLRPSDLRLVVEVTSLGSRRMDQVMKRSEYAEAGIPAYWVIDADPLTLTAYQLTAQGDYESAGTFADTASLLVDGVEVRVELAALAAR